MSAGTPESPGSPPRSEDAEARARSAPLRALLLGLLATWLVLEGSLGIYAMLARRERTQRLLVPLKASDGLRILCLGESTTALGGESSYPRQLESALRKRLPGRSIHVVNGGLPGANSPRILLELGTMLEQVQPQIVVAMMGANDAGDKVPLTAAEAGGSERALEAATDDDLQEGRPRGAGWLSRLRSYRLAHYLLRQHEEQRERERHAGLGRAPGALARQGSPWDGPPAGGEAWEKACSLLRQEVWQDARPWLQRAVADNPGSASPALALGEIEMMRRLDFGAAETLLLQACRRAPRHALPWLDLAWIYERQGKRSAADRCFEAALSSDWTHLGERRQYYVSLAEFMCRRHLDEAASRLFEHLERTCGDQDAVYGCAAWYWRQRHDTARQQEAEANLARSQRYGYVALTRQCYCSMLDRLRSRGIRLIAMQYPRRSLLPLQALLDRPSDVVFVENRDSFHQAIAADGYESVFSDLCYGDLGHCTPRGNALIAQRLASVIEPLVATSTPQDLTRR